MTVAAGESTGQVLRVQKRILLLAASVARETALRIFFWIRTKSENEFVRGKCFCFISASSLLTLHMRLAGPMAGFARHGGNRLRRLQPRM